MADNSRIVHVDYMIGGYLMDKIAIRQAAVKYREYIPQPYEELMELNDGFEAICIITGKLGGNNIYVPSMRAIFGSCVEMDIKDRYNGFNHQEIARIYGYNERYVRAILGK